MSFNIDETLKEMAEAIKAVFVEEWPKVRGCVKKAIEEERDALAEIARVRLAGEIDDEELKSQLEDERLVLEAALEVCKLEEKVAIQKAVNAALKVLEEAIKSCLPG